MELAAEQPPTEAGLRAAKYKPEGEASDNLYICGLPTEFDTDSTQQFFSAIGQVLQCKSFGHGYALVRFSSIAEAVTVKNSLTGQKPIGCIKPLTITFAISAKKDDWHCPRCGDLQFQKNSQCRMCGCPRPKAGDPPPGAPPGSGGADEGGDWKCPSCGDLQFKRNLTCRLCGTPSPGQSSGAVPASVGTLPVFGKVAKGKGKVASPYGDKGKGKDGKDKGGPMCSMSTFIEELVAGGLPGGDFDFTVNSVYVGGLPPDTTSHNLYEIFATFGAMPPRGAKIQPNAIGECAGFGYINFMERRCADMAVLALNGIQLPDGQQLEVRIAG